MFQASFDIAERLKNSSFGNESELFFSMDPTKTAEIVPEDPEGGVVNSYYNIPYSIVPPDDLVPFCGPNRTYYESRTVDGIEYGPDCWFEDPEFGPTPAGTVGVAEEGQCGTRLSVNPSFVTTNTDFGTQSLQTSLRFSTGVW
jgi:hypothetical protein